MNRCKRIGRTSCAPAALVLLTFMAWPSAAGARSLQCVTVDRTTIENLFVKWNTALKAKKPDGKPDPKPVVALYASDAILLPTVENGPYVGPGPITGYFEHFLENEPNGTINQREIRIGCNMVLDAGLYTFTYGKKPTPPETKKPDTLARYTYVYKYDIGFRRWLIWHHHSSVRPCLPDSPRPPCPPEPNR